MRIARTCRRMGISPVAVCSEADRGAPWLEAFDHVIVIGPSHPVRSYLDQSAVLEAARLADCQAIHPGWGFLAENAVFATRVRQLQIAFVGPSPRAIRLMGDKVRARETAARAGLPTIPGSDGLVTDAAAARAVAEAVGYPVLLKATAGGGGRGMRRVDDPGQLDDAFREASREAAASFGNGGLYVEKLIERGRHIEFQVLADEYGQAIHLGERECSVQRRHQKLIEESPSPALDEATRSEFGMRAAAAAATIGYRGAGTVEMLRDPDGHLYFMEMNTRLQVEHPITEEVTGIDIVEQQLRIAAGEPLRITQSEVTFSGHSIEARLNAEDVAHDFRPVPGTIEAFEIPTDRGPGRIRIDTHVGAGSEVPPHYDSLIAKVIAHAGDRAGAIETLVRALDGAKITGVPTTIPAHLEILGDPAFRAGDYDTTIVERLALGEKN